MSDGFNELVVRSQTFFTQLKANNNREWFNERKDFYNSEIRAPGILFADIMADELSRMTGTPMASKVYRIYRDVRFAKDKSPFNPWLHMMWSGAVSDDTKPWFFFGIDADALFIATGVMGLHKDSLLRYRAFIDRHGDDLTDVIEASGGVITDHGADPLKRVPKPYDPDHTHGDLLRRKSLIVERSIPADDPKGLVSATRAGAKALLPLHQMLAERL